MVAVMVMLAVTVWLSAVTSALPAPGLAPAVYVAVAVPSTNCVLVGETEPSTALLKTAGNAGRNLRRMPLQAFVSGLSDGMM